MKTLFVCLLSLLVTTTALFADPVNIPASSPVATVTFPEEWEASTSDSYVTAKSKDEKVNIAIDVTPRRHYPPQIILARYFACGKCPVATKEN